MKRFYCKKTEQQVFKFADETILDKLVTFFEVNHDKAMTTFQPRWGLPENNKILADSVTFY
jgi:hypothetical protein